MKYIAYFDGIEFEVYKESGEYETGFVDYESLSEWQSENDYEVVIIDNSDEDNS